MLAHTPWRRPSQPGDLQLACNALEACIHGVRQFYELRPLTLFGIAANRAVLTSLGVLLLSSTVVALRSIVPGIAKQLARWL